MVDVSFACRCGKVGGVLHKAAPNQVSHIVCYCKDCRAFARHLGMVDALEPGGGTLIVQVLPARIELHRGQDQIGCLRLGPKGLNRFFATCCNTPLATTPQTQMVPFAGMWRGLFADVGAFGPVITQGFVKSALPGQGGPRKDKGLFGMLSGLIRRTGSAYMNGTAKQSPFFDDTGQPVVQPRVLSAAERKAAYKE